MQSFLAITNKKLWLYSILLMTPIVVLHIAHFMMSNFDGQHLPTGFIHYDMPYYMANAREYAEADRFSFLFRLPFSPDYNNQAIYFYPQLFVLGIILKITSIDPAILLLIFGFVFGVLTIRICLKLLLSLTDLPKNIFALLSVLFIYGGGILFIVGFIIQLTRGDAQSAWQNSFYIDPGNGWWFLNVGRNFTLPLESYYHFLFFSTVYYVQKNKIMAAVICAALLSISHPFTGVLILSVSLIWIFSEKFISKNETVKWKSILVLTAAAIWFLIYNFILLPKDADHKALMTEWTIDFSTHPKSYVLGYALVAIPAIIRLCGIDKIKTFLRSPFNRFLIIWLLINLFWENHNHFMRARQPLHFTRGYVWACLFLIGLPVTVDFLKRLFVQKSFLPKLALASIVLLILSDNIAWFTLRSINHYHGAGFYLSPDQKDIIKVLNSGFKKDELLVSEDEKIGYLSTVYTPYRVSYSHMYNTPHPKDSKEKTIDFINHFGNSASYPNKKIMVVSLNNEAAGQWHANFDAVYSNKSFILWRKKK